MNHTAAKIAVRTYQNRASADDDLGVGAAPAEIAERREHGEGDARDQQHDERAGDGVEHRVDTRRRGSAPPSGCTSNAWALIAARPNMVANPSPRPTCRLVLALCRVDTRTGPSGRRRHRHQHHVGRGVVDVDALRASSHGSACRWSLPSAGRRSRNRNQTASMPADEHRRRRPEQGGAGEHLAAGRRAGAAGKASIRRHSWRA